jgi:hypothetical protein
MAGALAAADHDVRELLIGLVRSDGFRFRPGAQGE